MTTFEKRTSLRPVVAGDTLGVVAPASCFDRRKFDAGLTVVHDLGFKTVLADGLFERSGYLAGSDEHRAGQLQDMIADDRVQAVICARGGFGSLKLLPLIDWQAVADSRKPLVGFSDITALHWALFQQTGAVSLHGPTISSLADADALSRTHFVHALADSAASNPLANGIRVLCPGTAYGALVGGNLATLCHLVGTDFSPEFDHRIVFLEDTAEAPYRVDRMLTQMIMAGCFDDAAALLLGDFTGNGVQQRVEAIVADLFAGFGIPIVAGLAVGHGPRNITLPLGVPASLSTDPPLLKWHGDNESHRPGDPAK